MLKDLFSRVFGGSKTPTQFYGIYVQCDQCGEKIAAHINLHNDLSIQYGESDAENVYFVRKQLLGSGQCFNRIEVELTFDNKRKLIDREITGGRFISEEEFEAGSGDE